MVFLIYSSTFETVRIVLAAPDGSVRQVADSIAFPIDPDPPGSTGRRAEILL